MDDSFLEDDPPNPYRPGAGHMPPCLAGRSSETEEFDDILDQDVVLRNLVLTGLRGLGKTVLLEKLKPGAIERGWYWAGADLSESTSVSEEHMAIRLLTDLSVVTSSIHFTYATNRPHGFPLGPDRTPTAIAALDYPMLRAVYDGTPGLVADKLKAVIEYVWPHVQEIGGRGLVFAYDEAQNLSDHALKGEYPLSLLLDVFQSLQRKNIRCLLVLTGLPTLFPKLVEARTYAERMFHVVFLEPLTEDETATAVLRPLERHPSLSPSPSTVQAIYQMTRGYPYFVQYVCREAFDVWRVARHRGGTAHLPVREIMRKLDTDFFAGRWARATDRQRDLLGIVARLPGGQGEFSVQEITSHPSNRTMPKPFSASHVNQMLTTLGEAGLVYKNRHGRYSLALPLMTDFIRRWQAENEVKS